MSITDELREFIETHLYLGATALGGWKEAAFAIADSIDEAHKHAIGYVDERDPETMAENGWVKLPVDADGEYIHIGDRLTDSAEFKSEGVVESLMLEPTGWSVHFGAGWADERIHEWHHSHEPTVGDVLREFAEKVIDSQIPNVHPTYEEAIAEYAKRLRLAGEDE